MRRESVHHLVDLEQHNVLARVDEGFQLGHPPDQLFRIVPGAGERFTLPGGRVQNDLPSVERQTGRLEAFADGLGAGGIRELAVDARIPLLDDLAAVDVAEFVRRFIHLFDHEPVRGEQVVGREEVADHVGYAGSRVPDVEAHPLQGRAVPGVEIHLLGALAELDRERRVVDQISARRERPVVAGRGRAHEPNRRVIGELAHDGGILVLAREHPHVLEVRELRGCTQPPEDRLRVAEHPVAPEGLVHDDVLVDRLSAPEGVGLIRGSPAKLPKWRLHAVKNGLERDWHVPKLPSIARVVVQLDASARSFRVGAGISGALSEWFNIFSQSCEKFQEVRPEPAPKIHLPAIASTSSGEEDHVVGWIVGISIALVVLVAVALLALRILGIAAEAGLLDEYLDEDFSAE